MTSDARWLGATWPFVRGWLPGPPAVVLEIGCGPLGGFVPMLRAAGYDASGVDPKAPEGPWYHQVEFERYAVPGPAAAVVASTSLHHVGDVGEVLGLAGAALASGGMMVVVEWAWERFDDATARWCFARLPAPSDEHNPGGHNPGERDPGERDPGERDPGEHDSGEHNWLRHRHDEWLASGLPWERYVQGWAAAEGLHAGGDIVAELDARFDRQFLGYGPFFFADLDGVTEAGEQAAIDAGEIQANRIGYAGRRRVSPR